MLIKLDEIAKRQQTRSGTSKTVPKRKQLISGSEWSCPTSTKVIHYLTKTDDQVDPTFNHEIEKQREHQSEADLLLFAWNPWRITNAGNQRPVRVTYIVEPDVGMVLFESVVEDGHDDAAAGDAVGPRLLHVHVQAGAAILERQKKREKK